MKFIYLIFISLQSININCQEYEIAKGKQVRQSCNDSILETRCKPQAAVDGDFSTYTIAFYNQNDADVPWIQIDLEERYVLSRISISFVQRISRIFFKLYFSNSNSINDNIDYLTYSDQDINIYQNFNYSVNESKANEARFVLLKSEYFSNPLPVQEIQIFTLKGFKITQLIETLQSSTRQGWPAIYALDDKYTTCSSTFIGISWWMVNLGKNYYIAGVKIDNSCADITHQFNFLYILVSQQLIENGSLCDSFNNSDTNKLIYIVCKNIMYGSIVKIINDEKLSSLYLCDVSIYAHYKAAILPLTTSRQTSLTIPTLNTLISSTIMLTTTKELIIKNIQEVNDTKLLIGLVMGLGLFSILLISLILFYCLWKRLTAQNKIKKTENAISRNVEDPYVSLNENNFSIDNSNNDPQNIDIEHPYTTIIDDY